MYPHRPQKFHNSNLAATAASSINQMHCTMDQLYYKHKQASDTLKAWTDDVATSCKHNVRTSIMLSQIGRKSGSSTEVQGKAEPWVREIPTTDVIRHEWHEASDVPI